MKILSLFFTPRGTLTLFHRLGGVCNTRENINIFTAYYIARKNIDIFTHWLAIGGTFTVASGNELTKPRQNMKVKKEPLAFFQSLSRSIMH